MSTWLRPCGLPAGWAALALAAACSASSPESPQRPVLPAAPVAAAPAIAATPPDRCVAARAELARAPGLVAGGRLDRLARAARHAESACPEALSGLRLQAARALLELGELDEASRVVGAAASEGAAGVAEITAAIQRARAVARDEGRAAVLLAEADRSLAAGQYEPALRSALEAADASPHPGAALALAARASASLDDVARTQRLRDRALGALERAAGAIARPTLPTPPESFDVVGIDPTEVVLAEHAGSESTPARLFHVRRLEGGRETFVVPGSAMALLARERVILVGVDGVLRVLDRRDGRTVHRLAEGIDDVHSLQVSRSGHRALVFHGASQVGQRIASVFDLESGARLHEDACGPMCVEAALSPRGDHYVRHDGTNPPRLVAIDLAVPARPREIPLPKGMPGSLEGLTFVGDTSIWITSRAYAAKPERSGHVFDTRTRTRSFDMPLPDGFQQVVRAASPKDVTAVVMSLERSRIELTDLTGASPPLPLPGCHDVAVGDELIACASVIGHGFDSSGVSVWRGRTPMEAPALGALRPLDVAFEADGRHLLVATGDPNDGASHGVARWRLADDLRLERPRVGHRAPISGVAVRGSRSYSAGEDGKLLAWDEGDQAWSHASDRRLTSVAATRDGLLVAVGRVTSDGLNRSDDPAAELVRASSGDLVARLEGHQGTVVDVSFSRDGARLFTASEDGTVGVWATSGGKLVRRVRLDAPVTAVGGAPGDASLLAGTRSGVLWRIALEGDAPPVAIEGCAPPVADLAFARDGERAFVACGGEVRAIDLADESPLLRPLWRAPPATSLRRMALSPDERTVALVTSRGVVVIAVDRPGASVTLAVTNDLRSGWAQGASGHVQLVGSVERGSLGCRIGLVGHPFELCEERWVDPDLWKKARSASSSTPPGPGSALPVRAPLDRAQ